MDTPGFIIIRHVNTPKTNEYWKRNVRLLRFLYENPKIVIIDDNSNYDLITVDDDLKDIRVIQSEFPGRGELLPYYYLLKYKFFENAFIIHDSVFIHHKINFNKLKGVKVLPFWFFHPDTENVQNTKRIIQCLQNNHMIRHSLAMEEIVLRMRKHDVWFGCFGVQCYINLSFLQHIEHKYKITNLVHVVHNRKDRCCLERIFGCIFFTEYKEIQHVKSMLGDIMQYQKWGYTYDEYIADCENKKIQKYVIKVWTGR